MLIGKISYIATKAVKLNVVCTLIDIDFTFSVIQYVIYSSADLHNLHGLQTQE